MKRFLTVILLGLLTVACSSELTENRETRLTAYEGQSVWDMYENFGAPSYAIRVSPEEIHYIYRREEITRDWSKMYFDWCDMVFVAVNDYIVDWDAAGNQCFLNEAEPVDPPSDENERENIFDRYARTRAEQAENAYHEDAVPPYDEDFDHPYNDEVFF